jgi:hypothetical protein
MEEDGVAADMETYSSILRAILSLRYNPSDIQLYLMKNIFDEVPFIFNWSDAGL